MMRELSFRDKNYDDRAPSGDHLSDHLPSVPPSVPPFLSFLPSLLPSLSQYLRFFLSHCLLSSFPYFLTLSLHFVLPSLSVLLTYPASYLASSTQATYVPNLKLYSNITLTSIFCRYEKRYLRVYSFVLIRGSHRSHEMSNIDIFSNSEVVI